MFLKIRCINLFGWSGGSVTKMGNPAIMQSGNLQADVSPLGDEGCVDMNMSCTSIDLCSPDRIDIPSGWEAPAPQIQPVLHPLRLYVPELEEIRISPIIARKGVILEEEEKKQKYSI